MSGKKQSIRKSLTAAAVLGLASVNVAWSNASVSVPVWLIVNLSAITLITVCAAAVVAYKFLRKTEPGIESPATAQIFGIRWRWTNHEGDIRDITSFCPKCDQPVTPTMEARHGFIHLLSYKCRCGKWRSKSFHCSQSDFIERVCRAIQRPGAEKPS
jgi:hypothetical protein